MVSFITSSKALALSTILSSGLLASASNLRAQSERQLQGGFCGSLGFNIPFICPEQESQCPVVSPLDATQFDLDQYIEKSWYIQRQQINPYQSENQLYCIVATYNKTDTEFIDVKNYGNNDEVNGPAQNSDNNGFFSTLCAKQVDAGDLAVAPCFLEPIFDFAAGPYWVLAVADDYSWAIVSGGQPDQPYQAEDGSTVCTTKEGNSFFDTNGSGLWLFTREQVATAATIEAMETKLEEMGVYTGLLKNVAQEGCVYEGATLKE
jgi:lipocalin